MISQLSAHKVCCRYSNTTDQFQIIRVANWPTFCFERTVLPRETIHFEADPQDTLEVHTGAIVGAILSDRIPCNRLQNTSSQARHFLRQQKIGLN